MKSKTIKTLVAIVMALTVAILCMPMSMAAETSGNCGESATWSFNESTGELEIEGTGAVEWTYDAWSQFDESDEDGAEATLKSLVIADGITDISTLSFQGCYSLVKVTVPASVTEKLRESFINQTSVDEIIFKGTKSQWNSIAPECFMGYEGDDSKLKITCSDGTIVINGDVSTETNTENNAGANNTNAPETTTAADKADDKAEDKGSSDNTIIIAVAAVVIVAIIAVVAVVLSKKKK